MSKLAKALTAAAGNAAGESLYVEDVFSTYLYSGTSASHDITNNVNLADEGGLVWIKGRSGVFSNTNHRLFDTERGVYKHLATNLTSSEGTHTNTLTAFNSDGFTLGTDASLGEVNYTGMNYASWTFRKAEKFFDVVTYTGTGSAQTVSHNLGSTPGVIIVKATSSSSNWFVLHTGIGKYGYLDGTFPFTSAAIEEYFGNDVAYVAPTDSLFSIGSSPNINVSGTTYVAYLFASDAGGFGDDGSESIIKCGSYTGTSSAGLEVDLGFEPQWLLIKNADRAISWHLTDSMRGLDVTSRAELYPNLSNAEWTGVPAIVSPTSTGFVLGAANTYTNVSGEDFIYIAIRRPMKTPESGTEVFAANVFTNPSVSTTTGFPVDMFIQQGRDTDSNALLVDRLRGTGGLVTQQTSSENGYWGPISGVTFDDMDGFLTNFPVGPSSYAGWAFKRATGFFDVVAYTGDGVAGRTVAHNLGVAPEMMIIKQRNASGESWLVYHTGLTSASYEIKLNFPFPETSSTAFNGTAPTSSVFSVGGGAGTNGSGSTYIAYLFATLAGVSKVGSYTGTGSNVDVDCGFSAGARFVLIKRKGVDYSSGWYVWDSVRGIVAGNDPYLLLNSTAAEVTSTDYIDPLASGFTVTSSAPAALNASGENYIFLAIA